jgi:hypothetical protein
MTSAEETSPASDDTGASEDTGAQETTSQRIRRIFHGSRDLLRIAYRDPIHLSERLTLYSMGRLAERSRDWARDVQTEQPDTPKAHLAEELRINAAQVARIDGAISGTPFLIALVPGYLAYLWEEMRMTLRMAALYGHDPQEMTTAAEMLALRQVHPDVTTAEEALIAVRETPVPERVSQRRPLRLWVDSVYRILVFGGFLSPSNAEPPAGIWARVRAAVSLLIGIALWVITWVFPLTFMIMMAWGCQTHSRQLGRRALVFYDGEEATLAAAIAAADRRKDRGHQWRAIGRSILLFLSVAVPMGFVVFANHVRQSTGINWVAALGALVAVSLVIATAVAAGRR